MHAHKEERLRELNKRRFRALSHKHDRLLQQRSTIAGVLEIAHSELFRVKNDKHYCPEGCVRCARLSSSLEIVDVAKAMATDGIDRNIEIEKLILKRSQQ